MNNSGENAEDYTGGIMCTVISCRKGCNHLTSVYNCGLCRRNLLLAWQRKDQVTHQENEKRRSVQFPATSTIMIE